MGKKKRCSLAKQQLSTSSSTNVEQQALRALRRKHYNEALKIIRRYLSRQVSANLYCIAAVTHRNFSAEVAQHSDGEFDHLTEATSWAELAVEAFPNSVQIAALLASLLFRLTKWDDIVEWDKVIEVCTRALTIENSTDPGILEELLDETETNNEILELRIEHILLMSKCHKKYNLKMKKLVEVFNTDFGKHGESVLIKEDFMGLERRKDNIEEILNVLRETMTCNYQDPTISKNFKEVLQFKHLWGTLKAEKKRGFLQVKIEELKRYSKSLKFDRAVKVLDEALRFAREHKTWKFLECCDCAEKFVDYELYRNHCRMSHLKKFESEFRPALHSILQEEIDSEWIEMIVNSVWKPIDTDFGMRMITSSLSTEKDLGEYKDSSVEDVQERISEEESVQDLAGSKNDENVTSKTSMDDKKWPLCHDSERAGILEKIRRMFLLLLENKFLAPTHVRWAIQYTFHEFEAEAKISPSQFRHHGLESPKVICFLGVSKLKELHEFLEKLAFTFGLSEDPDMGSSVDFELRSHHVFDVKERVVLSEDFSCLLLDKRIFTGELNITNFSNAVAADGSAAIDAVDVGEYNVLSDSGNEIVSWIWTQSRRIEEELKSWTSLRDYRKVKTQETLGIVLEEYSHSPQAFNRITKLCLKDPENREAMLQHYKDMAFADSIILWRFDVLRKYKVMLEKLSTHDYRAIIVPLLKLFLQTHLEDLLDEDAKEEEICWRKIKRWVNLLERIWEMNDKLSMIFQHICNQNQPPPDPFTGGGL